MFGIKALERKIEAQNDRIHQITMSYLSLQMDFEMLTRRLELTFVTTPKMRTLEPLKSETEER